MSKTCGTCKWWDNNKIKSVNTGSGDILISDCMSQDSRAESFVETGLDGTLEKYPMIVGEGEECQVYEECTI